MTEHESWQELAAGYALHALEPAEEVLFRDHLTTCAACTTTLADHQFVAAQLGSLPDQDDVPTPSWASIRPTVLAGSPGGAQVVSLDRARRRRVPQLLSAAAAVATLAAGGVLVAQALKPAAPTTVQAAIASCEQRPECDVVRLQSRESDRAVVLLEHGSARVLATGLAPAATGRQYVLWQLPRDGRPTLVSPLPDLAESSAAGTHQLVLPLWDTAAFAISVERADSLPTSPGTVVAVGSA